MKGVFIKDLTYPQCCKMIDENSVIVLPIGGGSKEHGSHLPMGTDWYVTEYDLDLPLYVEEGYQLLVVKGTLENVGTTVISDSCFSLTATVNDEYVVDGYDVRLNFERDKYFEVDPYTEQAYNLYINIPDKLAEMFETASFTIGFKDDMSIPTTTYGSDGSVTVDIDQQYVFTSGLTNAGCQRTHTERPRGQHRPRSLFYKACLCKAQPTEGASLPLWV